MIIGYNIVKARYLLELILMFDNKYFYTIVNLN